MLILNCPYCGIDVDETDLTPGGEAHINRADATADADDFEAYLFHKRNPKGVHFERWRHSFGCGKWFHAARDTMTLEVFGTYSAQTLVPPKALQTQIKKKRPDWKGYVA